MKQKQSAEWRWSCRERAWPNKRGQGITLAVIVGLAILFMPESFASEVAKGSSALKEKARKADSSRVDDVSEGSHKADQTPQLKPNAAVITTTDSRPRAETRPVEEREKQLLLSPATGNRGKQIKKHLLSSGTVRGGSSSKYHLGFVPADRSDGTVGQVGVGSGSSESFSTRGGFWQTVEEGFLRGDANGSGKVEFGDVIYLINYLFRFEAPPDPYEAGDANCDGQVKFGDVIYLVNYLFRFGPEPAC